MAVVRFRYWAGARHAAGRAEEEVEADTVVEALAAVRSGHDDPAFTRVLSVSALLLDGTACPPERRSEPLSGLVEVEVLPPFAGG